MNTRVILQGDRRQHGSVAAGSPLKLLEERAGVPSVEVAEIMRQEGDYKKAVRLLSEGNTAEGFDELDRLGWVREVPDAERYLRLAEAYLDASAERKRDGSRKQALVSGIESRGCVKMERQEVENTGKGEATVERIRTISDRTDEEPKDVAWLRPFLTQRADGL